MLICSRGANIVLKLISIQPEHDKTYTITCAPTEDSDQPGLPPILIRVFSVRFRVDKNLNHLQTDSEDSDQTEQSSLGSNVFWVGFVMLGTDCVCKFCYCIVHS